MIVSAKEAQRLSKTRWQTELCRLDFLIKSAIWENKYFIFYEEELCPTTIEYLDTLGYRTSKVNNIVYRISWEV